MSRWSRIRWDMTSIPFAFVHVMALGVFFVPFAWKWVGLCLALYFVRMFAITAGYHRYFAHRSYRTSRAFQFFMACLGTTALQKGPLWWAAHHRHHHVHSDSEHDLHSPVHDGFWWAHLGWILSDEHLTTDYSKIPDFAKYPELRWINKYHLVPGVSLAVVLFFTGGLPALIWGFFFSTVLLYHGTFAINSLTHMFGRRRYATTDGSRNSLLLALITLGEGWHNNHHYYMASTRQGFFWWEIDISYYILRALSKVGLVWRLKEPPRGVVYPEASKRAA